MITWTAIVILAFSRTKDKKNQFGEAILRQIEEITDEPPRKFQIEVIDNIKRGSDGDDLDKDSSNN